MRAPAISILACVLALLSSARALPQAIEWRHSLAQGVKDARGKRMILVFVGTSWDPWTSTTKSRLDSASKDRYLVAARHELMANYIPVKVDSGTVEGQRLCAQYKVKSFPMFLYFSPSGELIMKRAGYGDRFEFVDRLILARQLTPVVIQAEQKLKKDPNDALSLELLAMSCAKRWMPDQSRAALDRASKRDPHNHAGKLGVAYNSLGDYYQQSNEFETAISFFQKGAAVAKDTAEKAYSLYSISSCYLSMGHESDMARQYAQAVLDLPNLSEGDRRIGERLLRLAEAGSP